MVGGDGACPLGRERVQTRGKLQLCRVHASRFKNNGPFVWHTTRQLKARSRRM